MLSGLPDFARGRLWCFRLINMILHFYLFSFRDTHTMRCSSPPPWCMRIFLRWWLSLLLYYIIVSPISCISAALLMDYFCFAQAELFMTLILPLELLMDDNRFRCRLYRITLSSPPPPPHYFTPWYCRLQPVLAYIYLTFCYHISFEISTIVFHCRSGFLMIINARRVKSRFTHLRSVYHYFFLSLRLHAASQYRPPRPPPLAILAPVLTYMHVAVFLFRAAHAHRIFLYIYDDIDAFTILPHSRRSLSHCRHDMSLLPRFTSLAATRRCHHFSYVLLILDEGLFIMHFFYIFSATLHTEIIFWQVADIFGITGTSVFSYLDFTPLGHDFKASPMFSHIFGEAMHRFSFRAHYDYCFAWV